MPNEETGSGMFAKAFGAVAGAGIAGMVLFAIVVAVVIGLPTLLCIGSCAGLFVVGEATGPALDIAQSVLELKIAEDGCRRLGEESDCWRRHNAECVQGGQDKFCWLPPGSGTPQE